MTYAKPVGRLKGFVYARQGWHDVFFWPYRSVAMIREEGTGRLEVTSVDGDVGHCADDIEVYRADGPWAEIAPGVLVHPAHVRVEDGYVHVPGGWRIAFAGQLPPPRPEACDYVAGTAIRRDGVLFLKQDKRSRLGVWVTDEGEIPAGCGVWEAAALHGDMIMLSRRYVNRRRIRAFRPTTDPVHKIIIAFDSGFQINLTGCHEAKARASMGLPTVTDEDAALSPQILAMFRLGLRDYPFDLWTAPAEALARFFGSDATFLMTSVLWQIFRQRKLGLQPDCGESARACWYRPMLPILVRAGMDGDRQQLYTMYLLACRKLVGKFRLCTYGELGFRDHRPDMRGIGTKHPAVIVLCEKVGLAPFVHQLAKRFGVSWHISQGATKLMGAEHMAADLRAAGVREPLIIIAYVDYDPPGWIIARSFARQLARYGMETKSVKFVMTPDRFTREELQKLWHPLKTSGIQGPPFRRWMEETHGIGGKARGMYSNHLVPYERVEQAIAELTGLRPGGERALTESDGQQETVPSSSDTTVGLHADPPHPARFIH